MKFKIFLILILLFAFISASEMTGKNQESTILYSKYLASLRNDKFDTGFKTVFNIFYF